MSGTGKSKSGKKSAANNSVSVTLEKAEEQTIVRQAIAQVDPQLIASIKNAAQLREEQEELLKRTAKEDSQKAIRNRVLFYGGVAAGVVVLYLTHRYFKAAPPDVYVPELINGAVDLVSAGKDN